MRVSQRQPQQHKAASFASPLPPRLPFTTPQHVQSSIPKLANTARTTPSSCSTPFQCRGFLHISHRDYNRLLSPPSLPASPPPLPLPNVSARLGLGPLPPGLAQPPAIRRPGEEVVRASMGIWGWKQERELAGMCVERKEEPRRACMDFALASMPAAPLHPFFSRTCMHGIFAGGNEKGELGGKCCAPRGRRDRRDNGHDVAS